MKTGNYFLTPSANMNAGGNRKSSLWFSFVTCCRFIILLTLLNAAMSVSAQTVATGYSTTKGNFETDADYYTNTFQFPDTPCVVPAGAGVADDWIGPALNPPQYGTYPFGPFPVGTGFGRVDSTGAAAFKASIGCNVQGAGASNATHLFPKNFDSLQAYLVPVGAWPNSGDTMVLIDAFAARDHYGLSGSLDQTTFTGQSNKNTQDPGTWTLGPGTSGPNKNDLIDVGVALDLAFNAPKYFPTYFSPFDFTAHGFATTLSTSGDSHIDAEIFKTAVAYDPGCNCMLNLGPDYGHSAWTLGAPPYDGIVSTANPVVESQGDLLISADYSNGGVAATIALRIWIDPFTLPGSTSSDVETRLQAWNAINDPFKPFNFGINQGNYKAWDIDNPSSNNFGYFEIYPTANEPFAWARVNARLVPIATCPNPSSTNTLALPWGNLEGSGAACQDSTLTRQTLEVTIDDSRLGINLFAGTSGGNGLGCEQQFGSIMYKTRTSTSFTAELKDFAGPFPFVQIKLISLEAHATPIDCDQPTGSVCVDNATSTSIDPLTVTIYGPAATSAGPFTTLVDSRLVPPAPVPYCVTGLAAGFYQVTAAINAGCDSVIIVEIEDNTDLTDPTITCPPTVHINCGDAVPACETYATFTGTISDNIGGSGIDITSFQCSTSVISGGLCGSYTRTYSIADNCGNTSSCTQTIDVDNIAVQFNCPAPGSAGSCSTQAQVDAAFAAWLTGFTSSGGCNRQASYGSPAAPAACGGTTNVTYTVTSDCEATQTCSSSFSVTNAPAVQYNCPAPSSFPSGQTQADVDAAFAAWLAGFTSSGGCDRVPSTGSPVAPAACGGTTNVTLTVTSSCEATRTCSSSFTVEGCPAIQFNCPAPGSAGSCLTQADVDAAFAAWLTGFTSSGGCNRQASYGSPVAPAACGGTTNVTYTVSGDCAQTQTCSSSFSVTNAPAVQYNCPAPGSAGSCSTQAQVDAAFAAWLTGFTSSGGCDRSADYGTPVAPNRCGGTTNVTYTVTSSCEATRSCSSSFSVTNAPAVQYNCPAPGSAGSCSTQADVDAAFAAWLTGFTSSGGCDRSADYGNPVAPNACGGTTNVTYTITSTCEATRTCSSSFTVDAAPAVQIDCPAPVTAASCSTQGDIDAAFDAWLQTFTFSGGCGASGSFGPSAQTTTVLAPINGNGKDAAITTQVPTANYGTHQDFESLTWTCQGILCISRSLIEFDLSSIPAGSVINSATLRLYANPIGINGIFGQPTYGTNNAATLRRITQPWDENTVTWNNQPTTTTQNEVILAQSVSTSQNYFLNVTNLTQDMIDNPSSGYGFMMGLINQTVWYNSLVFCSSDHPNTALAPALEITYTPQTPGVVLQPIAPDRCGGTTNVTYTVTSNCEADQTCSSSFTVTNAPAVQYNCPAPGSAGSCSTQAQVDAAFAAWLTGFTSSGGCDRVPSYGTPVAPNRCGGTTNVTYTVTSSCEATHTCSSSFTVDAAPAVQFNCPAPSSFAAGQTQADVDAAFAAWLAGFTSSGGCDRVPSYGSPVAPNACGGTTNVTYTVTSSCEATRTCSSSFTVEGCPAIEYNCPAPGSAGSCSTQAQVDAAFAAWLTGFTSSGGCDRQASYGNPVAPNRCGGTTNVTYTVSGTCSAAQTCSSSFTVTNAPAVQYNCPAPGSAGTCSTQAQVDAAFAAWLTGFTSSGGCDRVPSYGSPVAPARCGGTTNVTYTVTSSCEATRTCSSSFTVPTSPTINIICPANRTVGYCQRVQSFTPNVTGGCSPQTVCVPASGSTFPVGTTTVTCTATDACNSNSCSFTITVIAAPTCNLVPPTIRPICGSTGNQLCVTATGAGPLQYSWTKVSGALWQITGGQGTNCITYTAGSSDSVVFAVLVTDVYGCTTTCTTTYGCRNPYWGCTLGFWKNHTSIWDNPADPISACIAAGIASMGVGYSGDGTASSSFMTTFGLTPAQMTAAGYPINMTLLQALNLGGGSWGLLARSGVAALLNSCGLVGHFYFVNPTQVITMVHNSVLSGSAVNANATGNIFQTHNETQPDNCPPAGPAHKRETGYGSVMANDAFGVSAYPNPFSSSATIEFEFTYSTDVVVAVYNLNGDKVAELYNGNVEAGQSYKVQFNGENLPSGVYIYKIDGGDVHAYDKLVLMK